MNKSSYLEVLEKPKLLSPNSITQLKTVIEEYPYFQSARVLYLKALKNQESFKYNNELKVTSAYTTDRTVLFNFITSNSFKEKGNTVTEKETHKQVTEKIMQKETVKVYKVKKELSIGKPISFLQNEAHSFNQWLQLSVKKPIIRNQEKQKTEDKSSIIDKFIQNNPKISRIEKGTTSEIKINENIFSNQLMTETLAKVYLEQKKYENAIKAYKILSLKYPEKSGFFADQIKRIQILQNLK